LLVNAPFGNYAFIMRIGIVGARLSGCYAALLLARAGHDVLLFDPSLQQAKPCGGGVTAKAWRTMPWIREYPVEMSTIDRLQLHSCGRLRGELRLRHPVLVVARPHLEEVLRNAAVDAGARHLAEKAIGCSAAGSGWFVRTAVASRKVDFLVGADGTRSIVRRVLGQAFATADLSLALGYRMSACPHPDAAVIDFQERGFRGYMWSFPHPSHSTVGILRWLPTADAAELRRRVTNFLERHHPGSALDGSFYAASLPCLSRSRLLRQRVCGRNWALVGDAAGFADSITGEGIFYALRSAELLARSLACGDALNYEAAWRRDFGDELAAAAEWCDRFFGRAALFRSLGRWSLDLAVQSAIIQEVLHGVVAGRCSY